MRRSPLQANKELKKNTKSNLVIKHPKTRGSPWGSPSLLNLVGRQEAGNMRH